MNGATRRDLGPDRAGSSGIFIDCGELMRSWGTLINREFSLVAFDLVDSVG